MRSCSWSSSAVQRKTNAEDQSSAEEVQLQDLMQLVEYHRKLVPRFTKAVLSVLKLQWESALVVLQSGDVNPKTFYALVPCDYICNSVATISCDETQASTENGNIKYV